MGVKLTSHRKKLTRSAEKAGAKAVASVLLDLKSKSVPLAPLDKGDLRRSASIDDSQLKGSKPQGAVGYGEDYALEQHENVALGHDEGQAKFLEAPATQNAKRYEKFIIDAVKEG